MMTLAWTRTRMRTDTARGHGDGRGPARRESGSIAVIVALSTLALTAIALGGATLGMIVTAKGQAQRAADAAAVLAVDLLKDQGLPWDATKRAAAEQVARLNTSSPMTFTWTVVEERDKIRVELLVSIPVSVSTLIYDAPVTNVEARVKAEIPQQKFDEATRRLPKLVLVLDYSGSMRLSITGSSKKCITLLEESVNALLDANLMIEYGMVAYSEGIRGVIPISPAAPAQIQSWMAANDEGGYTYTGEAMLRARGLLTAPGVENTGLYVLLVTDGQPEPSEQVNLAKSASQTLWASDVTIFSLQIDRGGGSWLAELLQWMSGPPDSPHNPDYAFRATTADALRSTFEDIIASIVCQVGPLDPVPADPATLDVFLVGLDGSETKMTKIPDGGALSDYRTEMRYLWDPGSASIRITQAACNLVIDGDRRISIRYGRPVITE